MSGGTGAAALTRLLAGRRTVALVGAGCSTESGIPDYRGPEGSLRRRAPVQYQAFVRDPAARVRYWARSVVGWPRFSTTRPNAAHAALARLEHAGLVHGVITQNVDGLHGAAGSRAVVELHGSLARVRCLGCQAVIQRQAMQDALEAANGSWLTEVRAARAKAAAAPDGDAELADEALAGFVVPDCAACGGLLKPDVVFFGESVPGEVVAAAWDLYRQAQVLLVVGTSLAVFSGRRFVYRARDDGVAIAVMNVGPTRADEWAAVRVDGRLGETLPALAEALLEPPGAAPVRMDEAVR